MAPSIFIVSPTESVLTRRGDRHPKLAATLNQKGHKVCYVSTDFYHADKRFFSREEIENAVQRTPYELKLFHVCGYGDNISIGRLWGYVVLACKVFFFLLKRVHRGDVIIVPCRPPEVMLAARWIKILKRSSLLLDVRDVWPDGLPLRRSNPIHCLFYSYCVILNRLAARGADFAFYTATGFRDWLFKFLPEEKSAFIPLGYDADRWQKARPIVFEDFQSGVVKLLFVGDYAYDIELKPLIKAVGERKSFLLTFIGGGDRLDEAMRIVQENDYQNVVFKGRLDKETTASQTIQNHLILIPKNVKYSLPNKFFDGIGAYRPLLVWGNNDASEIAVSEGIGWKLNFNRGEEEPFLDTLTPELLIAASSAIAKIRSKYSKEVLTETMIQHINELIKK